MQGILHIVEKVDKSTDLSLFICFNSLSHELIYIIFDQEKYWNQQQCLTCLLDKLTDNTIQDVVKYKKQITASPTANSEDEWEAMTLKCAI